MTGSRSRTGSPVRRRCSPGCWKCAAWAFCVCRICRARVALAVELGGPAARLPLPARHPTLGVPSIVLDAFTPSAAQRVALALDCAEGRVRQEVGAFTPEPGAP